MASAYTNKYVSDIPLKRPQETFVDAPNSLDEVNLSELMFDLAHGIKNIGNLHVYHAVAIFQTMLEDLIYLAAQKDALRQFRSQQLSSYSLDLDVLENSLKSSEGLDLSEDPASNLSCFEENSAEQIIRPQSESADEIQHAGFISTESLVETTSLDSLADPITCLNIDRLKREILFHMAPKVKVQASHLLKCFGLAKAPPLSIKQFLVRIKTYSPSISISVYIHSAYMIYKLCVLLDVVELTSLNVYRFILASLRCSTKKLEDVYQKQKSFAMVGGVALKELCKIEVSFLYLFNFKMVVSEHLLNGFLASEFGSLHEFCEGLRKEN